MQMQKLSMIQRGKSMGKYIRRAVVFNENSEREMKIYNWAIAKTKNFKDQNFASFVRDKLEWCMQNEDKTLEKADPVEEQPNKKGWRSLI
jgi:hypothetical protein